MSVTEASSARVDARATTFPGARRRGDVLVRADTTVRARGMRIGPEGVVLIRDEDTRNAHRLIVVGAAWFSPSTDPGVLGHLEVGEGGAAWTDYMGHRSFALGPGSYCLFGSDLL
jgi:hypothetical protein